ncbi:MAG: GNAT family N-acetyltransferase [Vicinamibacterales bacterium]
MATPLATRLATETDVPALVALVNSAYRGDSSRAGWTTEADLLDGMRIDAERLSAAVADAADNAILIHEDEGHLVACVHLQRKDPNCYLGMLTTLPTRQGSGLGRSMIEQAERFAHDHWGSTSMEMTVLTLRQELLAWYERRGYSRTGDRKPFPYGDDKWGLPKRTDLEFYVLRKSLTSITSPGSGGGGSTPPC